MKKVMLVFVAVLMMSSAFAFDKGTINFGGNASFSVEKANSDADALTTLILRPQAGYYVADNICADLIFIYESQKEGNDVVKAFGAGLGARYFLLGAYGGLDLQYNNVNMDTFIMDGTSTSFYIIPKLGYLLPLGSGTYLDLGARYQIGVGDYGGDGSGANKSTSLQFSVGLEYFLGQ